MKWEMLSGSLWLLRDGKQKLASVSLNTACGGWNAQLLPPAPGSVLLPKRGTAFPTEHGAKEACELAIKEKGRAAA